MTILGLFCLVRSSIFIGGAEPFVEVVKKRSMHHILRAYRVDFDGISCQHAMICCSTQSYRPLSITGELVTGVLLHMCLKPLYCCSEGYLEISPPIACSCHQPTCPWLVQPVCPAGGR